MKYLPAALLLLALILPLRADNQLQNGDFSDGISHWHGDARSPADYASDNPLNASDPFTSKGLIMPLKHSAWSKVEQDFKPTSPDGTLTVTYMVSNDIALSTRADDYANISESLGWGWVMKKQPAPGQWMLDVFSGDQDTTKGHFGSYTYFACPTVHTQPQTVKTQFKDLTPQTTYTVTIAFPPGTGTVVVLNASVQGQ
jgi:hypothetical protein